MQMPALLLAILLAGGNPVWDQQSSPGQAQICSERVAAQGEALGPAQAVSQSQKTRRMQACPAGAKPLAEAAPVTVQTR